MGGEGWRINQQGSILVFALVMAGTALMGGAVLLRRSVTDERANLRSVNLTRAFHLSEAGLDLAIQALRTNPAYVGTPYTGLGNGVGGYSIEVIPDGPWLRTIRAVGFYPSNNPAAADYAARTIETVVQVTKGTGPGYGILGVRAVRFDGWGRGNIRQGGNHGLEVDSYDSRRGPYARAGAHGNLRVCTNNHEEKAVALAGRVTINGDILLGPGSDPQETLWRAPKMLTLINGSVSVPDVKAPVESVEIPALPDRGRLSISGHEVVTLPGGLYRFHDIQISGNGTLVFTGPAEVYVEEDVQLSGKGGIQTASQLPTDLSLYVKGAHVSIRGDPDVFARLVAPNATVEISGNGDLYGAVTGREVMVRGRADVHYDEALNLYDEALNPPRQDDPLQVTILSWRDVSP